MIKLAVRVTDLGYAMHVGGDPEVQTHIFEIDDPQLEQILKPQKYITKSISIVAEDK